MSKEEQQRMWAIAGRYMAVGLEMAIALSLPTALGLWLDKRFDTNPWLMLAGVVIGVGAMTRTIMRIVKMQKSE